MTLVGFCIDNTEGKLNVIIVYNNERQEAIVSNHFEYRYVCACVYVHADVYLLVWVCLRLSFVAFFYTLLITECLYSFI